MKTNFLRITLLVLLLAFGAFGQTQAEAVEAGFPSFPLPVGIAAMGAYNQLGNPQLTMAVSAIYPVRGAWGLYGTTTADLYPQPQIDPGTSRRFYSINANLRQGFHKDVLDTGRWSFLLGGDIGPGVSQLQPSGWSVSLSGSFVVTALYQVNPVISVITPLRMLRVADSGWNPVLESGIVINLKNLPKAKK
jgi:hypothetical protein